MTNHSTVRAARHIKRAAMAALLGIATLTMAACGNRPGPDVDPSRASSASQPSVAPSPSAMIESPRVEPADFSGEAVTAFGKARVDSAYAEVSGLLVKETFREGLLRPKDYRVSDFAGYTGYMTPNMRTYWNQTVQKAINGDQKAADTVKSLTYFNMQGDGVEFATTGPLIVNQRVTADPKVAVERGKGHPDRLQMTVSHYGEVRMVHKGSPIRVPMEKTVTVWLEPATSGGKTTWMMQSYAGNWAMKDAIPDTAG